MLQKIKLRFLALSLTAILICLVTQPSMAFYTSFGTATNVVTSGNIQLIIHETTDQGTPFPEEGVYVIPGDIVSKVVTVENDCAHPFYLRIKAVYAANSETLSPEECFALNINTEYWTYHEGWYYYNVALQPGEMSQWFFSQVEIVGSKVNTSHIGMALNLTVVAQAVQSENNPVVNNDPTTAIGWPAE